MNNSEKFSALLTQIPDIIPMPIFDLTEVDSNAFSLMGHWQRAARKAKWNADDIDTVLDECRSGDYNHLVAVLMDVSGCERDVDDEDDEDNDYSGLGLYDDEDDNFIRNKKY